jgi:hypothetical protein
MATRSAPPIIALSTAAIVPRSLHAWRSIARDAGAGGVDVDLSTWWRRLTRIWPSDDQPVAGTPVVSAWIARGSLSPEALAEILERMADGSIPGQIPLTIVVNGDGLSEDGSLDVAIRGLKPFRERTGNVARIAIAIQPRNPEGGRDHLRWLQLLRHLAGEWDFDIALDLLGGIDDAWEAEAAILKLGPRLRLIRSPDPTPQLSPSREERLVRRIMSAALGAGFGGILSIRPYGSAFRHATLVESAQSCVMGLERIIADRQHTATEPVWHPRDV